MFPFSSSSTFSFPYRAILFLVLFFSVLWAFWTIVNAPLSNLPDFNLSAPRIYATELESFARFKHTSKTLKEENDRLKAEIDMLKQQLAASASLCSSQTSAVAQILLQSPPDFSQPVPFALPVSATPPPMCRSSDGPILPVQYLFTPQPSLTNVFLSVSTDPGGGLGHQLVEFLWAPWLARKLNATYLHTRFVGHSAVWNRWLMFGDDELEEEDLKHTHQKVVVKWAPHAKPSREQKQRSMKWLTDEIDIIRRVGSPNTAYVFMLKQWTLNHPLDACWPSFNRLLRQKYCAARIRRPVLPHIDYFSLDEREEAAERRYNASHNLAVDNREIVRISIHFRAGNNAFRDTGLRKPTFYAVLRFINISNYILTQEFPYRPVYYFITQSPDNMTADAFFEKFFSDPILNGIKIRKMYDISSRMSFHLMAYSHIHMGSKSGFSQVPQFFRRGLTVSPFPACIHSIFFNHFTGEFDEWAFRKEFKNQLKRFGLKREKLESWEECAAIREFPPIEKFDFDKLLPG